MNPSPAFFEHQHERLEALLHAALMDIVGADFDAALTRLQRWRADLAQHIEIENTQLLPHLPEGARWGARMYLLEHDRIALLADEYLEKLQSVALQPPQDELARRGTVLMLIDAAHALRHVLEHHHEREHQGLAQELPLALQAEAWQGVEPGAA